MERATRLIIENGKNIVFIKRKKRVNGKQKEYYTLPGGHVDSDESWENAGIREAKEELDVDVELDSLLIEEYNEDLDKIERFYFAKIISGKIKPGSGEEFKNQDINSKYGTYEIVKLSKQELSAYNILPITIKDLLVSTYI